MRCAGEMRQDLGDFLPCTHDGYPVRLLGMFETVQRGERLCEDVAREEDQGLQCDMVRRSRSFFLHGQMEEHGAERWSAHVRRVALVMEEAQALGPWPIRLFRADAQVCEAY